VKRRSVRTLGCGAIAALVASVSVWLPSSAEAWYTGGVFWQKNTSPSTNGYYCTTSAFNAHASWIPALDVAVDNYNSYSNGGALHPQWTAGCPHANHPIDVENVPLGDIHYGGTCGSTSNNPPTPDTSSIRMFNSTAMFPTIVKSVWATVTGSAQLCTSSDIRKVCLTHATRHR
jgi:hypothetical protein